MFPLLEGLHHIFLDVGTAEDVQDHPLDGWLLLAYTNQSVRIQTRHPPVFPLTSMTFSSNDSILVLFW